MAVDLKHLRSFVAVAEEGKISAAARRLFITQPALSRQIQQLEREVGESLLVRVPHGVELTETGREVLDRARTAIEAADDALSVGDTERPHGRLVLGLPVAGRRPRWFELTQEFVESHPAVEVEIREAMSEQLQRQVLARELDGAITVAPNHLDGLTYTRVFDDRVAVWLHRDHALATRPELTLADLHGQELTILGGSGRSSGFNAAIRSLFAGTAVEPHFIETPLLFPPSAGLAQSFLTVTVPLDFPESVVSVPLVPPATFPFEFVQHVETNRSALRAYARFAAERLQS